MLRLWLNVLLVVGLSVGKANADLPEFGFCPLGGPTGWFNRLKKERYKPVFYPYYYYPQPVYPAWRSEPHPLPLRPQLEYLPLYRYR